MDNNTEFRMFNEGNLQKFNDLVNNKSWEMADRLDAH